MTLPGFFKQAFKAYISFFTHRPAWESLLLGGISGLILFPIPGIQLVLFGTLSRLFFLFDMRRSLGCSFLLFGAFFFGYFFVSLHWICHALTFDLPAFWWAIPVCLFGVPAFLSLIPASIAPWFMGWTFQAPNRMLRLIFLQFGQGDDYAVLRLLMIATWIGTFEFLMDDFFPWAAIGNTWASVPLIGQTAALGGVFTLSFLTIALMGVPYLWVTQTRTKGRLLYTVVSGMVLLGMLGYGTVRLANPISWSATTVRLVQPGIPNRPEWKAEEQRQDLNKLLSLSAESSQSVNAIIWPEAILSYSLAKGSHLPAQLGAFLKGKSDYLITGAVRRFQGKVWNSIYVVGHQGVVGPPYDKHHLVPFGEYIPFRAWFEKVLGLRNLKKVTAGMQDFSTGAGMQVLETKTLPPFCPMICYEAIFPGHVVPADGAPSWLLHVTEDSWFGRSVGPYQHFQISRMRAIEEGVPVVRVANTGISGVIDPYGRVVAQMPFGHVGTMDVRLPDPLQTPPLSRKFYRLMAWIDEKSSLSQLVS